MRHAKPFQVVGKIPVIAIVIAKFMPNLIITAKALIIAIPNPIITATHNRITIAKARITVRVHTPA